MAQAMTLISSQTLGSTASSVTFSSIPGTYRDLFLVVSGTISSGTGSFYLIFNGDMTNSYSTNVTIEGNGTTAASYLQGAWFGMWGPYGNTTAFGSSNSIHSINLMDYSATDKYKPVLMKSGNSANVAAVIAGRWASTAAITSLGVYATSSTFTAGSTFYLYGIVA
jgi:hypothetical protein